MLPSKVVNEFWLYEFSPKSDKVKSFLVGKWMIFAPLDEIDENWEIVKNATAKGILGFQSKVSTAKPNSLAQDINIKVIIVYTHNYQDKEDVNRVREELRSLGFDQTLYYKTDQATKAARYGERSWLYRDKA